ncbi:MAG: queuosine precursor transporter [Pseudomonadota bacterium]
MTNELLVVAVVALMATAILSATYFGKPFLFAISCFIIVVSNATVGIQLDVFGLAVSWGVIVYSFIYLITDILSELFEEDSAYQLAFMNVFVQVVFWIYLTLTFFVETRVSQETLSTLEQLYATTPRITLAALVAVFGAFVDIWVYEKIKKRYSGSQSVWSGLWFRNNVSTIVGQSVNTVLFFTIALWGVVPDLLSIILTAIAIKAAIALVDTPLLYAAKTVFEMRGAGSQARKPASV